MNRLLRLRLRLRAVELALLAGCLLALAGLLRAVQDREPVGCGWVERTR